MSDRARDRSRDTLTGGCSLIIGEIDPVILSMISEGILLDAQKVGQATEYCGTADRPLTLRMLEEAIDELSGQSAPVSPSLSRDPFVVGVDLLWWPR